MESCDVLTTGQVAQLCAVAPRTVAKWVDSGRLKGYKLPGSQDRRIPARELLAFLESHSMTSQAASLRGTLVKGVVVIGREAVSLRESLQSVPGVEVTWRATLLDAADAVKRNPCAIVLIIQSMDEVAAARVIRQQFGLQIPVIGIVEQDNELAREFRALGFSQVKLTASKHLAKDVANTVGVYTSPQV